jgi:monofunctional biosynthetic peptidoglycan transglycosylase
VKEKLIKIYSFLIGLLIILFQLSLLTMIVYRIAPVPVTPLMIMRNLERSDSLPDVKSERKWVPIKNIAPVFCRTVIASEDPHFLEHYGFDFEQIQHALKRTQKDGKKLRGASTISQQTAKNIFLLPTRSWIRKGVEAYFTLLMETLWTKKRIFEVYLNIIEMGDMIFGIEAASQKYFKKTASGLNAPESALLVACFPNPRRFTPVKPSRYIRWKQTWILRNMRYISLPEDWHNSSSVK